MMTTEEWNDKPCGGTDPDMTPEAVERICQELLDTCKGQPAQIPWPHRPQHKAVATLRALSAALEAEKQVARSESDLAEQALQEMRAQKARAEALDAKLKEALSVLKDMRDDKTGFRHAVHFRRRAAVYLASLEGDKP